MPSMVKMVCTEMCSCEGMEDTCKHTELDIVNINQGPHESKFIIDHKNGWCANIYTRILKKSIMLYLSPYTRRFVFQSTMLVHHDHHCFHPNTQEKYQSTLWRDDASHTLQAEDTI